MAGAGYKLFTTGSVLTAAEVNTYLQEQAVMRFATVAARTAALSGVLAEGMVSYIDATDTLEVYNGSAWISAIGDITEVQGSTGISVASGTGPVPVITNSMATAIDAKGDLVAGTGADAFARLAVGNNGETLVADSSTSTGLRWQQPKTQNAVYNSGMDIWQRGTSFTGLAGSDYTADRWLAWATTVSQSNYVNRQAIGNLSVTPNQAVRYALRFGRTAGTTNTGARYLFQTLENADSIRFTGKTVTFSFYARRGANYSQASNGLDVFVTSGTGTDQIYYSFTSPSSVVGGTTVTLGTSWQRFQATGTVSTSATQLGFGFVFTPSGTAGADDWFEITGVQLEEGSVATPYSRQSGNIAGELAACQRYYFRTNASASTYSVFANGWAITTTAAKVSLPYPVQMRTKVTSLENGGTINLSDDQNAYTPTSYSMDPNNNNSNMAVITANVSSGLTQYRPMMLRGQNDSTAYLGFSAEL